MDEKILSIDENAIHGENDGWLFLSKSSIDRQLCFYVKISFVSEKTQKSQLCHFL